MLAQDDDPTEPRERADAGQSAKWPAPSIPPKLRIPHTAIAPVYRGRLLTALDDLSPLGPRPVTVVSGPAGSGKTTLLATWARKLAQRSPAVGEGHRVAWVTLDARDNAPSRLWSAIAEALSLSGIHDTTNTPAGRHHKTRPAS